jgi:putative membrane protein
MTHDAFVNLLSNVVAAVIFSAIGVVLFIIAFMIFDKITPGSLWKELIEDQNTALGVLMGAVAIALAIIIAASVH